MKLGEWISNAKNTLNRITGKPYYVVEDGKRLTVAVVGKHEIPTGIEIIINDEQWLTTGKGAQNLPVARHKDSQYNVGGRLLYPGEVVKFIPPSAEPITHQQWEEIAIDEGVDLS